MKSTTILRHAVILLLVAVSAACAQFATREARPGQVRTVTMRIHPFVVPRQAVTRNPNGQPVAWVVGQDDIVEERVLETGPAVAGRMVVKRGLSIGDRVIVGRGENVRPGVSVRASATGELEQRNVVVRRFYDACATLEREIRHLYRVP